MLQPFMPSLPTFRASMEDVNSNMIWDGANTPTTSVRANLAPRMDLQDSSWRRAPDMKRLRARVAMTIEYMLRTHRPHQVLTEVPENINWRTKTFQVALKIEGLMFRSATSRESYADERSLRSRVQALSRQLVRIRKRKNAVQRATV